MQWSKALLAGAVGGVVISVYSFVMHGVIMRSTYEARSEVFRQDANEIWFPIVSIVLGLVAGAFFAKSRSAWSEGIKGGVNFGFWVGLVVAAGGFYAPLIYEGFPYYLSWCWAGINLLGWSIYGAVVGAMYKPPTAA
jgi:hypothetical protein